MPEDVMAKAARRGASWKRPGSPIGRRGPRKQRPRSARNNYKGWPAADVRELRRLAKENTPTRVIGLKLGRTAISVRGKAQREGISLRPTNQSPYNRRKRL
jgi:hypothetical protein